MIVITLHKGYIWNLMGILINDRLYLGRRTRHLQ